MFGRSKPPATKAQVLFAGVFMSAIGALLCFAMITLEPAPDAPPIALAAASLMAFAALGCGLWLLATALRMFNR